MTDNAFRIAVMPGDGIGIEVMDAALAVLDVVERRHGLAFRRETVPGGAIHYKETGVALPEDGFRVAEAADAVLFGAMGWPDVRYPDGTEIAPQLDLRVRMELYAGVRPIRAIPGVPLALASPRATEIDLVILRESTEGMFALRKDGVVEGDRIARDTMVITRDVTERLSRFAFRLAARRAERRDRRGKVTIVDKANVFKAFNWQRDIFRERAAKLPEVKTDMLYVDACAAMMVKKPWDFDVMVMENMFGDILSDLAAGLIGGLGIAPSADIGDKHAVFQPCHGTAPDIMGQGKANPTAMILSAAMMLDWLSQTHDMPVAAQAGARIERAVDDAYRAGLRPMEYGGGDGTAAVAAAVMKALG